VVRSRQLVNVNQRGARADGDIVAGNKIKIEIENKTVNYILAASSASFVIQLLDKLKAEIEVNAQIRHTVENLQYFYERRAHDGIEGLEAKLIAADRKHELFLAFEKNEQFAKLLEKWSLYASAQEFFAYMLAKAEHEFTMSVLPRIRELDQGAVNQLVNDRIVVPTIAECGCSVFTLNHTIVMGMVYWLAEQCFVRWHQ
jgi:hypothetical protein